MYFLQVLQNYDLFCFHLYLLCIKHFHFDNNKNAKISYKYSDFGETEEFGDTDFYNEIAYTGGIYDESTSLYYLNARYYNPEDARFITQDTYRGEVNEPNTLHLYSYCANNPINYVDPTGHTLCVISHVITGSVIISMTATRSVVDVLELLKVHQSEYLLVQVWQKRLVQIQVFKYLFMETHQELVI